MCGKQLEVEIDEQIASHYMLPPSRRGPFATFLRNKPPSPMKSNTALSTWIFGIQIVQIRYKLKICIKNRAAPLVFPPIL